MYLLTGCEEMGGTSEIARLAEIELLIGDEQQTIDFVPQLSGELQETGLGGVDWAA